uniref:Helicase-like transcription factor n=1 Tax=Nothobranchius korthausae TaxID=1143690 RepID=A0A1A8EJ16_9TELE
MSFRRWGFGWGFDDVDLFSEPSETQTETLSQIIRAARAEEPDADGSVLFGNLKGTVVGLRYYTGVVNRGEMVGLVREPQNPYDRNAVKVTNIYGSQVGHIKKELAAAMAYVMDRSLAKVEGVVHTGVNNTFSMPVMLSFWGKEEDRNTVMKHMASRGYKLNTGSSTGGNLALYGASASSYKKGVTVPLTAEELKNAFDNLFDGLMESKDGEKEAVESVATALLPHQKQALSWMCARENKDALPPCWEKRGELYYNSLTCFSAKEPPGRVRGGILADDMGLGKTLTTIALILTNFHNGKPLPVEKCEERLSPSKAKSKPAQISKLEVSSGADSNPGASRCSELMTTEVTDIDAEDVVVEDEPQKGKSKKKKNPTKRKPRKEDLVLFEDLDFAAALSGSTSAVGAKKKKTAVKTNPKQSVESSVTVNSDDDLSARTTLIICPLSVLSNWLDQFRQHMNPDVKLNIYLYYGPDRNRNKKFLSSQDVVITTYNVLSTDFANKGPLNEISWLRVVLDEGHVVRNPNAQMSKAVLELKAQRRWILSGTPIQNSVKDLWMLLALHHRQCSEDSGFCRYVAEGSVLKNYADVLAILMRLRQHCCHGDLLPKTSSDLGPAATPAELQECLIEKLRLVLASGSDEECSVCLDSLVLPVITHCAHVFCRPCIAQVIGNEQDKARCPLCRSEIKTSELVEFPPEGTEQENVSSESWRTSSKIQALMGNLLRLQSEDDNIKCLVVSQFTRFLTILETPLRQHGFRFVRFDGSMSQQKRTQVIQEFQSSAAGGPTIMLLSLKAGGVGLNLTAASRVFLMDPAWNPATEEQCIDRCHRLGQNRKVVVTKFIVKNSVEENMVKIQRKKQDLVEKAFGSSSTNKKTSRIDDIRALMEL